MSRNGMGKLLWKISRNYFELYIDEKKKADALISSIISTYLKCPAALWYPLTPTESNVGGLCIRIPTGGKILGLINLTATDPFTVKYENEVLRTAKMSIRLQRMRSLILKSYRQISFFSVKPTRK